MILRENFGQMLAINMTSSEAHMLPNGYSKRGERLRFESWTVRRESHSLVVEIYSKCRRIREREERTEGEGRMKMKQKKKRVGV